jgi:hypothetical protein
MSETLLYPLPGTETNKSEAPPILTTTGIGKATFGDATIPGPPSARDQIGPIEIKQQGQIVPNGFEGPLFNDYGFVVRAKSDEGEDILLWMFIYRQQGPEIIIANDVTQTAFIATKFSDVEKTAMHDTPFINQGQNIEDYHRIGTLETELTENKASWSIAGRELGYENGEWYAKGQHAGVEVDLRMTQRGECFYHVANYAKWDWENNRGIAGGNLHVRVNGTIKANNKTYTIRNGHGVHERIIMAGNVPERINYMGKGGAPWMHSFGERLSFFTIFRDFSGTGQFSLTLDNELVTAVQGPGWVQVKEKESWLDPKTKQVNPRSWLVQATTELGKFEAIVTGYGRYYYTWTRRGGTLLVHCYMADVLATFTKNDGTVIQEKQLGMVEYMRTLYNQNQSQQVESL